jgi:type II secretory ATPase GspE/PulE/Tfp pilus assembly ATPase PilB-like protein
MAYVNQDDLKAKVEKLHREGEERAAERLARDAKVAVIQIAPSKLALAAANPELPATKKIIEDLKGKFEVKVVLVSASGLQAAWRFYKFVKPESEVITGKVVISKERLEALKSKLVNLDAIHKEFMGLDFAKTSPVAIIEIIFAGAVMMRASDIHTEAGEKLGKIRFRIDGILHDIFNDLPSLLYRSFVSRIKLLSGMKINVYDEAQDGRFTIAFLDKEIEMRVSVIPAEFGETIVMRILDPAATMVGLPDLGLREDNLAIVKKAIAKPNGLILNTGPTGSGKTTTLYAFLRTMNSPEVKIITLEDPIEYRIEGVEQTQVDEDAGYTFANGLRAIVRQDPDIILVGEVRDLETADIALQAALTGHLVLSTLHTNDAIGAVPRLINLGVKSVSIGPALTLVIAQRLVRVLCPHCKKAMTVDDAMKAKIDAFLKRLPAKVDTAKYATYAIYEPVGCEQCNNLGYKGRVGIFEFLEGGPDIEDTILKEASERALRAIAKKQEMVTMQEDGILKILEGKTTFSEVEGTTGEIAW